MNRFQSISFPSTNGIHTLQGILCMPQGHPLGIVHIVHGVAEHIARYKPMMQELADAGYIAVGFDLPGHGQTVHTADELGYFGKKDGAGLLIRDTAAAAESLRRQYNNLPYYLFGHSMGSFIARCVTETFTPDKLILMGTAGPNPVSIPGLLVLRLIRLLRGDRYRSNTAHTIMFGGYNARFPKDDPYHWLSTDPETRKNYADDPLCGFVLTAAGAYDLICLCSRANRGAWFRSIQERFPVLLLSGAEDPVGNFGAGVRTVAKRLRKYGTDVVLHLYENGRHEIHNDIFRVQVMHDLLDFLTK
jgi:alpha-beta hydrolase superfamily lysophospholipase